VYVVTLTVKNDYIIGQEHVITLSVNVITLSGTYYIIGYFVLCY